MNPVTGRILHLQRLSTEDGPGLRTTVFLKGCPLHCAWCHNPECISKKPQTQWFAVRCLGCNTCLEACPNDYLTRTEVGLVIDRARCQGCGQCAEACPAGAIELLGKTMTVDELLAELLKDRAYFEVPAQFGGEKSGGGVTLSGGEPTLQPDFVEALLRGLKDNGISTALDTCGLCTPATLDHLLPYIDLVLYDLKLFDSDQHHQFTGSPNRQILDNLLHLRERQRQLPFQLWIRTPLIPEITTTSENLSSIGHFLADKLDGSVARWELCAFNNLCRDQYTRLNMEWDFAQTPLMTPEELAQCEQVAKASGVSPEIVLATGATRVPELF